MRVVLSMAALTGLFCAVFALVVSFVTMVLSPLQLSLISFLSGALGSLFAQLVLRRGNGEKT
jgi:hypothetical protein